jgi:hypothetical protein
MASKLAYGLIVGSIQLEVAGLTALAGHCQVQAALVGRVSTPSATGANFQSSAAAVQAAHADVAHAGAKLMARLRSIASTVSAAAVGFATTEATSTADIGAVGSAVV